MNKIVTREEEQKLLELYLAARTALGTGAGRFDRMNYAHDEFTRLNPGHSSKAVWNTLSKITLPSY